MHDPEKTYQQLNQWQAKKIERLLAESRERLKAFWNANREITRLEDCMREIQAATSDKQVLAITDKALCDEPNQYRTRR